MDNSSMIVISSTHKADIQSILANYTQDHYDAVVKKIIPILKEYYPTLEPSKIGRRLLHGLFNSWLSKPNEAIVHYWTICRLITEYQYPAEHIDLEVACGGIGRQALGDSSTRADIVVYSHESRRPGTALIAIECREYKGVNGAKQAASYSRALQSKYHLFTDSEAWQVFETQSHPIDGIPVSDIPRWVGAKPLAERLAKHHILPPITDEKQLRDLIKYCHDAIHSEGVDPAKAFDELVKLFFVKVYDEQEIPNVYQFSVLAGENTDETGNHVRQLLKQAKTTSRYKELFTDPGDDEFWISNASIRRVVETFQGFSFTGNSLIGIDAKGTVYENMVGSTFRGELGQYFTPRKIVEFMVDLLAPNRTDIVWDPSCGSGGFLIYVLRQVAAKIRLEQQNLPQHRLEQLVHNFVNQQIVGTDINPRMVRAARMNMIMHGDGWSGIQRCHGLEVQSHDHLKNLFGSFTLVLSNPPFAGFEVDDSILTQFSTGQNSDGLPRGVNRAIIFVEQIIRSLAEGGRAGMVLPRSIFENESYAFTKLRKIIFSQCEIIALVGLPRTAFHHTDCGILGDLLFIKKVKKPRTSYEVFVAWAENVGYNTLGHNVEENDFPAIMESYKKHDNSQHYVSMQRLLNEKTINPWHYHPDAQRFRAELSAQREKLVPLTELVSVYNNRISRRALRQTPERILEYAEVRDFDPETGIFSTSNYKIGALPSRATYELNGEELLLLPNARNSLESGRKVIKIGQETKGLILTNRFLPLRPKVNPEFLLLILNTEFIRNQLIAVCKGAGSPDFRETKLGEIMVPLPNSNDLMSIDTFMEEIADKLAEKKQFEKKLEEISDSISIEVQNLLKPS